MSFDHKDESGITVMNMSTGAISSGKEAFAKWLESEKNLEDEYGQNVIFQIFRMNMEATNAKDFQGPKLAVIKVGHKHISGTDTVNDVKKLLTPIIGGSGINFKKTEQFKLFLNSRPMNDNAKFYDHGLLLPCFIQVAIYDCTWEEYQAKCKTF